jgi:hypothetical protein
MQLPHHLAIRFVRTDETRQSDGRAVSKEFCDFADAADVLGAVFWGEPKVLVQTEADVVAV